VNQDRETRGIKLSGQALCGHGDAFEWVSILGNGLLSTDFDSGLNGYILGGRLFLSSVSNLLGNDTNSLLISQSTHFNPFFR
jgi:hypothetical protein